MPATKTTIDHTVIQQWAEDRDGKPARVKATGQSGDPGILRLDFPGYADKESLEHLDWDTWFDWFDRNELAFVYEEGERGGEPSRFHKLVSREQRQEKR